jgi:4-azaleucine resistance transporter AzlC
MNEQRAFGATLKQGALAAVPIVAGYVVLGIPCGILAAQAQLTALQVALMSLLFYSGAGQYMIPNMWLSGSPIVSIALSVSLINSRQILYAASLSRFLEQTGKRLSLLFAATVTDESYAVNLAGFNSAQGWSIRQATIVNVCAWITWIAATVFGALLGSLLSVPAALATFAMTSIFICLLFSQAATAGNLIAAEAAALGVLICKLAGFANPAIFIGALLGVFVAMLYERTKGSR